MATLNATTSQTPSKRLRIVNFMLRVALVVLSGLAIVTANWEVLAASFGTLILTYVPQLLVSKIKVRLPLQFELAIIIFLYASIILGEVGDFYQRWWWWDVLLHGFSSFAIGFAGFLILYLMSAREKVIASPAVIAFFTFTFGLAFGALWELFEYAMDTLFGTNMLKSGLKDTMGDLIVDAIGAGVASWIGYIYLKHKVWDVFDVLIAWFVRANPRFKIRRT